MKLSTWAKRQGIGYRAAWNMVKNGQLPYTQLPTGTIIIPDEKATTKIPHVVTYARVSSSENRDNLLVQSNRLIDFCNANGWQTHQNIVEVGSGLNDRRPKLLSILDAGKATKLVVEHKDRLARFGVSYIESLCRHIGCDLVVVNKVMEAKEDTVQDFVSVVTSFCARLYGYRRSRRKTEQLIKELADDSRGKS